MQALRYKNSHIKSQINIFSLQSLSFSLDADISHITFHRQVSGLISLNKGL